VRGEYYYDTGNICYAEELPPRARRIPIYGDPYSSGIGTTSACAENTHHQPSGGKRGRNYLRVRGEYTREVFIGLRSLGTTSACAENTNYSKRATRLTGNYLRVRGEYDFCGQNFLNILELPPRARRIRGKEYPGTLQQGTTSACAENTGDR